MKRKQDEVDDKRVAELLAELDEDAQLIDERELRALARAAVGDSGSRAARSSPDHRRARWAHPLRWVGAAVLVALLVGSGVGFGLGSSLTSPEEASAKLVGTGFLPARGWTVVQSGTNSGTGASKAIAANVALDPTADLEGLPIRTLESLPPDGVVIVATFTTRGDPGADFAYPVRALPLGLASATRESPASDPLALGGELTQYRLRAGVGGTNVDAHVYLGSVPPSATTLRAVELQLSRLAVASDRVTLFARPTVAGWTTPVTLFGSVDSGRGGETVSVQAKDCGSQFFKSEAEIETRDGGGWSIQFSSGINTVVRAVWNGSASAQVAIRQRQFVFLDRQRSGSGFRVGVSGKRSFWHKKVVIQRRQSRGWTTVKTVVLTDSRTASGSLSWTEAKFGLDVPKGTFVRAVLPLSQARPCYLAGVSRTVRT